LHAIRQAAFQVGYKLCGAAGIAGTNKPARDQLGLGVDGNPHPGIANYALFGHFFRDVLLFASDETPDLVALQPLAAQVAEHAVLVSVACFADTHKQARHGSLLAAQHAAGGADRIAFNQSGEDLGAFVDAQAVHEYIIRDRSRISKKNELLLSHEKT
jgi:hypothetical protein